MEQNRNENEIEIDLKSLFITIWDKKWIVTISGIVFMLLAFIVSSFVISPVYESSTRVYVMNTQNDTSIVYSDLQSSNLLTNDYKELTTSRPVLESVIQELGLDMTTGALADSITVSIPSDTRILKITVKNEDPYLAQDIADAVRVAAAEHIVTVMGVSSVNTETVAGLPTNPSSPNIILNSLIGLVFGVALAGVIVILTFLLDDTIKSVEDVERYLGIGVLGTIPLGKEEKKRKKDRSENKKVVKEKSKK